MGRPPIGPRPMTLAERLRRHRAAHGRGPDPTNAARQQRWRDRQAAKRAARAPEPGPPDLLLAQAVAILEGRGEDDQLRKLRAYWPFLTPPVRHQMAAGKGFRFLLRED